MGNRIFIPACAFWTAFSPVPSFAAEIRISSDAECRVDIEGQIEFGDFEKLTALKDRLVINNGESTSGSLICLNSPGGSLVEGLKMARFILDEGIGTRIRNGKECQSVCAIMFMMGNARGDEVAFLDRRMDAGSTLGFHRPYLSISEAREFSSGDVEAAYDVGIESIYDLMALANTPTPWHDSRMIEPDLMEMMAGTPGTDMYFIRTVEQATRWQIGVDGLPAFAQLAQPHVMYACESALNSGYSLTSVRNGDGLMTEDIFDLLPANDWSVENATRGVRMNPLNGRYATTSPRAGYSSIGCEVVLSDGAIEVCGYDESSDTRIGDCITEGGLRYFERVSSQHPVSDLKALMFVGDAPPDAIAFRQCRVFDASGTSIDDEVCLHSVVLSGGEPLKVKHLLEWQSGARTVIEIDAKAQGRSAGVSVNGQPGELISMDKLGSCAKNLTTGNWVCSAKLAP
ncbi:hypothetical protein [Tabrizicola sp. BL-A-41-H6]|uniref:COG3904 family protein n=1 Tax=Tabrizicola sp. BL-A-41-H6 TaxID=3421107 RepID=UPI003D6788D5